MATMVDERKKAKALSCLTLPKTVPEGNDFPKTNMLLHQRRQQKANKVGRVLVTGQEGERRISMVSKRRATFLVGSILLVGTTLALYYRKSGYAPPDRQLSEVFSLLRDGALPRNLGTGGGAAFPEACSAAELSSIRIQLPKEKCLVHAKAPWRSDCSFSYATRCPESTWLNDHYREYHEKRAQEKPTTATTSAATATPFTSIYVGCNKAMDAISTLRMGSANPAYDKQSWRNTLFQGHDMTTDTELGHCGQALGSQFAIPANAPIDNDAVVHCIEPLPGNSKQLAATAKSLGIQDHLQVHAVAMSNQDGRVYFPVDTKLGDEQKSIDSCTDPRRGTVNVAGCEVVPMYKLDTFVRDVLKEEPNTIDFLSIDVEGYDALVLQGGSRTLSRVKYLEFEYNWKGPWANITLSATIDSLKEAGFACYWAGSHGNIWRITDCWLDHYDVKIWSNVACVNVKHTSSEELVERMEQMFRETIRKGRAIQYKDKRAIDTGGKIISKSR